MSHVHTSTVIPLTETFSFRDFQGESFLISEDYPDNMLFLGSKTRVRKAPTFEEVASLVVTVEKLRDLILNKGTVTSVMELPLPTFGAI